MRGDIERELLLASTMALCACGPRVAIGGEEGFSDGYEQAGDETGAPDPDLPPEPPTDLPKDGDGCQDALDILMVVDNSYSMASAQRRAGEAIGMLLGPMDQHDVDWRLAVTNTGVYGHGFGTGVQPYANGRFQFIPCNDQLEYFSAGGDDGFIDVSEVACTDLCTIEPATLYREPSTTHVDDLARRRPWIERIDGFTNLVEGIDPIDAARCIAPQGIDGSGFEQPLEAMALALERAEDPEDEQYGFLRPDASLLVIIVTDEADCSTARHEVFSPFGEQTFWPEGVGHPTGAICWNAGVSCSGAPPIYDHCEAVDLAPDGSPTTPEDASMVSVSHYISVLEDIEAAKQAVDPGADVAVLLIAGIGLGGDYIYGDVSQFDEQHMIDYGMGPGCRVPDPYLEGQMMDGIPPVRLREVAEAMSTDTISSICQANFGLAFGNIYEQLFGAC